MTTNEGIKPIKPKPHSWVHWARIDSEGNPFEFWSCSKCDTPNVPCDPKTRIEPDGGSCGVRVWDE